MDWEHFGEGFILPVVIVLGVVANIFSLVIIRNRELNLIKNFSNLLQVRQKSVNLFPKSFLFSSSVEAFHS